MNRQSLGRRVAEITGEIMADEIFSFAYQGRALLAAIDSDIASAQ